MCDKARIARLKIRTYSQSPHWMSKYLGSPARYCTVSPQTLWNMVTSGPVLSKLQPPLRLWYRCCLLLQLSNFNGTLVGRWKLHAEANSSRARSSVFMKLCKHILYIPIIIEQYNAVIFVTSLSLLPCIRYPVSDYQMGRHRDFSHGLREKLSQILIQKLVL